MIDGCPSGLKIDLNLIRQELHRRKPGQKHTSQRQEKDCFEILSGVKDQITLGSPISVIVYNEDVQSSCYQEHETIYRPGHADITYHQKYGLYEQKGGGRASARETVGRVIAGAIAKCFLVSFKITITSTIDSIKGIKDPKQWDEILKKATLAQDSVGGVITTTVTSVPPNLGQPIYYKMEAMLANAMLSLPSTKGFEIGEGFASAKMQGSEHNDPLGVAHSNHSGGTLGGITTGDPLVFKVAFKPISSIGKTQQTIDHHKKPCLFKGQSKGRHDPCPVLRALVIVEAMTAIVLADAILLDRLTRVEPLVDQGFNCLT